MGGCLSVRRRGAAVLVQYPRACAPSCDCAPMTCFLPPAKRQFTELPTAGVCGGCRRVRRGLAGVAGAMWEAGCKLPTQMPDGRSRCLCGAEIDNKTAVDHICACHMKEAAS